MFNAELSRRKLLAAAAAASVSVATHSAMAQDPEDVGTPVATPGATLSAVPPEFETPTNWPVEGYDLAATRNVQGSNIDSSTVTTMGDAWKYKVEVSAAFGALVASPAIVDGVVYQQDAMSNVYALNLETGEIIWTIEHNEAVPSGGPNGVGIAYGNVYYTVGGPADVIAVSAADGTELWKTNIQGIKGEGITIAPSIYAGRVYVSTIPGTADSFYSGGERGMIVSLDANTGEVIWYFDTTTDNLWGNAVVNSGGGLWHPPSFDEEGMVYAGTGNAAPYPGTEEYPNSTSRLGDNDYANSTLKIDPATGELIWYNNVKPFDMFDLDNHLTPVLVEAEDGKKLAISSGKHGVVIAIDRETGEEVWRTEVGPHENDMLTEIPEGEEVSVFPGTLGGVETSIAVANGKILAPLFNMASVYSSSGMNSESLDVMAATGQIVCLDLATGEILWDVAEPTGSLAGATVVNDVVFTGGLDGLVRAYNVEDGSLLWSYQATAGLNAPLAVSGDYLIIPAAGPWSQSDDSWSALPGGGGANIIAVKLGGEPQDEASATAASPEAEEASPVAGGEDAVSVNAFDLGFDPSELSIAADTDVTITFTNTGFLEHDFIIEDTDYGTDVHANGETEDLVVNLPAGEYVYFCSVAGHREQGMVGTLTVA